MSKKTRTTSNKAGKLMKCDGQMLKEVIEAKGYKLHELSKMLRYCSDYLTTCCRKNQISDVAAKYLMDYKIFPQMYDLEGEINEDIVSPTEVKIDKDEKKIEFGTPYGVVRSEKDLRERIKQAISPKNATYGFRLADVRKLLDRARANGLSYDVEDMRNDLLAYAAKLGDYSEEWVCIINHLSLRYNPDCKCDLPKEGPNPAFGPTAQEIKEILNEKSGTLQSIKDPDETAYEDLEIKKLAIGIRYFFRGFMREAKNDPEIKAMIKQAVKEAYEEL